ncbi:MAG: host attachment protein [Spongiibacteraceae bacterium]
MGSVENTWILVADSRRARVFAGDEHSEWAEVADFSHPQKANAGDNPKGHIFAAKSGTRHGMESATSPREKEQHAFAAELSHYLQSEYSQQRFAKLVLVAAPEFLGELRNALTDTVHAHVAGSIAKDLVACTIHEISNYVTAQSRLR